MLTDEKLLIALTRQMLFDWDHKVAEIKNKWSRSIAGSHLHYSRLIQCWCFGGISCLIVMAYTVQRLRQQVPLKRRHIPKITHGITSQQTAVSRSLITENLRFHTPISSLATILETIWIGHRTKFQSNSVFLLISIGGALLLLLLLSLLSLPSSL